MNLSAPKRGTWWVAFIVGALGVIEHYHVAHIPLIGPYSTLLIIAAWALLVLATALKGL